MRAVCGTLLLSVSWVLLAPLLVQSASAAGRDRFPIYPDLRPQVDFWRDVFSVYSKDHAVFHDTERLDRVYRVLDFRPLREAGWSDARIAKLRRAQVEAEKDRLRRILRHLDRARRKPARLRPEERRIFDLFADDPDPRRFRKAAERIRVQTGMRERFRLGLRVAKGYLPAIEKIFGEAGLPVELARLPLVESGFDVQARSRRGAAGIWQFMPATGRIYLRIDAAVDERRDPIASSRAAAQHLKETYEALGSWPLAITAYNHGHAGIARAVRKVGSKDLPEIIRRYRSPSFGFASRNFYAEFLAALEVERRQAEFFGQLTPIRPPETATVKLERSLGIAAAARAAGIGRHELRSLNPALQPAVVAGRRYIPAGYHLRVPPGKAEAVLSASAGRSTRIVRGHGRQRYVMHTVRRRESLWLIARRYGTSVRAILNHNRVRDVGRLRPGTVLRIPTG